MPRREPSRAESAGTPNPLGKRGEANALVRAAWIGDAVLLLFARSYILQRGSLDDAQCVRMTSNRFLSALGEPTKVEAQIGTIYQQQGWGAASSWIEEHLLPIFEKQEEKRRRSGT